MGKDEEAHLASASGHWVWFCFLFSFLPTSIRIKLSFPHTGPASERGSLETSGVVWESQQGLRCVEEWETGNSFNAGFLETFDPGRESVLPGAVGPSLYKGASAPAEPPYLTRAMTQQEVGEDTVARKGGGWEYRQQQRCSPMGRGSPASTAQSCSHSQGQWR